MSSRSSARHAGDKSWSLRLVKTGLSSVAAGALLLGFVSPALAADATATTATPEQIAAASQALETAKATLKEKQDAAAEAAAYQAEGSAGYFKYVGATGAYAVLTDPTVNDKLGASIQLGGAQDATSMANMTATLQYINECNKLREGEGLPDLQVSDTLMAMAQADVDWATGNIAHPMVFNIGENLSWGYPDPFTGWYDEEKAQLAVPGAHGHYDNIVNAQYATTGFAISQYPTQYTGNTFGQTFDFAAPASLSADTNSLTRMTTATNDVLFAGSRTMSAADYFADVQAYQDFLAAPQAAVTTAQAAVDTAQAAYDALTGTTTPAAATTDPAGTPTTDPAGKAPAAPTTPAPASDPASPTAPKTANDPATPANKTVYTAASDPAGSHLAKTGSNVIGIIALALGLCLTAAGAFTLSRKAR